MMRLIAFAIVVLALAALPFYGSRSNIQDVFFLLSMLTLAQFWNLLAGYAGLISVGQQAFVGIGAYTLFSSSILLGIDPLAAIVMAGVLAGLLAIPMATIAFRLEGAYFAIGTWVLAEILRLSVSQIRAVGGGTGTSLPRNVLADMAGVQAVADFLDIRASAARDVLTYWIMLGIAVATIALMVFVLRRREGLALAALRDDPEAAETVGVSTRVLKYFVYIVSAIGTGLTGAIIYLQKGRVSPDAAFNVVDWTAAVIFIVVIGGIGTIEGPIIGILIFFFLQSYLADFGTYYLIVLGGTAIAVMLLAPRGVWGILADRGVASVFLTRRIYSGPKDTRSQ